MIGSVCIVVIAVASWSTIAEYGKNFWLIDLRLQFNAKLSLLFTREFFVRFLLDFNYLCMFFRLVCLCFSLLPSMNFGKPLRRLPGCYLAFGALGVH